MAEILLSLTIIGIVAAITLPSLTGNINERTWNTQRKALYARMSQAISLMPALNGYGSNSDTAAETFVTAGLSKILKINNICDKDHLADCGVNSKITTLNGSKVDIPLSVAELNSKMINMRHGESGTYSGVNMACAAFETVNGESIVVYYQPLCKPNADVVVGVDIPLQSIVCANFIYDLNGAKGPNTIGKDVGVMTALFSFDSAIVAPLPHVQDAGNSVSGQNVTDICRKQDREYRLPSRDELSSIWVNQKLFGNLTQERYWSSSVSTSKHEGYYLHAESGLFSHYYDDSMNLAVRCIKR